MTLVVGFNFGDYSLLGADTRVSWYINDELRYRDDELKICRTQLGMMSGAGLCQLLDPVKERLAEMENAQNTDAVRALVAESRRRFVADLKHHDARVEKALDTTAWMFTYVAKTGDSLTLRLAVLSSEHDALIGLWPPNSGGILPPSASTDEQQESWQRFLSENTRPYEPGISEIHSHVSHHAALIRRLITQVASVNDGVAESFQIGIHRLPLHIGISGIYRPPDFSPDWDWG